MFGFFKPARTKNLYKIDNAFSFDGYNIEILRVGCGRWEYHSTYLTLAEAKARLAELTEENLPIYAEGH
jgi:hypothetical protein